MLAYCGNNPINYWDPSGCAWKSFWDVVENAFNESAGYFSAALGISQADSPLIGPADVAAICMAVAGLVAISKTIIENTPDSDIFNSSIENDIKDIGQSFGKFQCREAADSIADYLRRNNKHAELVTITFVGGRGYIWSDIKSDVISENGVHVGILFNGMVYCNVHPLGLPEIIWTEDFQGTGLKIVNKVPI